MNKIKKKKYETPEMEVVHLRLECGVAVNSAKVLPQNSSGRIEEEYDLLTDDVRNIDW